MCLVIILIAGTAPAYANIDPKPSVVINFEGLEGQSYYVTLLSEVPSTGPHSVLGEHPNNQRYHEEDKDYGVWQKFVSYPDEDGFCSISETAPTLPSLPGGITLRPDSRFCSVSLNKTALR